MSASPWKLDILDDHPRMMNPLSVRSKMTTPVAAAAVVPTPPKAEGEVV